MFVSFTTDTMKTYKLKIRKHEDYGSLGVIVDTGRPYFEPFDGLVAAHDIIEHPAKPHPCSVIDELMALGGVMAGRVEHGWSDKKAGGFRRISSDDLVGEISRLAINCFHGQGYFCEKYGKGYLNNKEVEQEIRRAVLLGMEEAKSEVEEDLGYDVDSAVAWICKGYQAYKRRFRGLDGYSIANHLFDEITDCCDSLIKSGDEGRIEFLNVEFNSYRCFLRDEPF
jgi:hypothetical protein